MTQPNGPSEGQESTPEHIRRAEAILAAFNHDHRRASGDKAKPESPDFAELAYHTRHGLFDPMRPGRPLTDLGNGERFADRNSGRACFCCGRDVWLLWDGRRWCIDDSESVQWLAKMTVRGIYVEAAGSDNESDRKALANWAKASESDHRIKAMLSRAQSELAIVQSALDADPWLLNCLNGTLDLRTGELRNHHPQDFITKLAPVEYDPDATLPLWDRFLRETTDDDGELVRFLARCAGYSLTGCTWEEVLFFIHGPTNAGKTTFLEAVKAVLGDYGATADFESFLKRSFVGGPRPDIARLAGARMVTSVEVSEGKRLAEGLVKLITGGDKITTRFLYKAEFEWVPQFTLWLAANEAPRARHDDSALWRRILKLPFDKSVPEDRRDTNVKATLRNPAVAGPAILAWAVQGCLAWQAVGLQVPERVRKATEAYRLSQDPLKEWAEQCCLFGPGVWTSATDLRASYEKHGAENGSGPRGLVRGKKWGQGLRTRGCRPDSQRVHGKVKSGWWGIGLLSVRDVSANEQFQNTPHVSASHRDFSENGQKPLQPLQGEMLEIGDDVEPIPV